MGDLREPHALLYGDCAGDFLKGVGMEVLWPQILALAGLGAMILTASALRFHKRLD